MIIKWSIWLFVILLLHISCNNPVRELEKEPERIRVKLNFSTGELMRSFEMSLDSLMEGPYTEYYRNGTIMREEQYAQGLRHGMQKTYFPDGDVESLHKYEHGYLNGPYAWYYKDGQVKQEGIKENGNTQGNVRSYFETGALKSSKNYEKGIRKGEQYDYYEDGHIKLISCYNSTGKRAFQIQYDPEGHFTDLHGDALIEVESKANVLDMTTRTWIDICIPYGFEGKFVVEKYFKLRKIKEVKANKLLQKSERIIIKDTFQNRENGTYHYYVTLQLLDITSKRLVKKYYDTFQIVKGNGLDILY